MFKPFDNSVLKEKNMYIIKSIINLAEMNY